MHKPTRRVCFRKKRGARRSRAAAALGKLFDVLGAGRLGDVATADGDGGHATRHFLINTSIYDALRRVYGGQLRREPDNYHGYSDHRPDLALLVEGTLKVFDLKVFDPISSVPGQTGLRGAYVGFGNTAEAAADAVVGRRRRGVPADGRFDRRTGRGHVSHKAFVGCWCAVGVFQVGCYWFHKLSAFSLPATHA